MFMRLAFLEHKFKLLDKCHVESYNDSYRQQNTFYGSFEALQRPQLDKQAIRSPIPQNLMPVTVIWRTQISENMS